jgi:ribosomal protein L37AE/L43A
MRVLSPTASRLDHIICPFCESGLLVSRGPGFARCDSCGLPLLGSALATLRDVVSLPHALGVHACECGHPEMRRLPDGVYHCPACGSEVLPVEVSGAPRQVLDGRLHRAPSGTPSPLEPTRRASA